MRERADGSPGGAAIPAPLRLLYGNGPLLGFARAPRERDRRAPRAAPERGREPPGGQAVATTPETFDVAFVCTGNRYRSVLAEAALRALVEGLPVRVISYGTLDVGPAQPLPTAVEAARAHGLDISGHCARRLSGADLGDSSLVLGFEPRHVHAAVVEAGARKERTFTLPELIELLDRIGVEAGSGTVERATRNVARAHESRDAVGTSGGPRIADPVGRPEAFQRAIGEQVVAAVRRLASQLFVRT